MTMRRVAVCADWFARDAIRPDPARLKRLSEAAPRGGLVRLSRPRRCAGVGFLVRSSGRRHALLARSEEHTSELQSLMRISYAVFCLKKKKSSVHKQLAQIHVTTNINNDIKHIN